MENILGIGLIFAVLAFGFYRASWYMRRGWKDHRWIWDDAHAAARFLLLIAVIHSLVEVFRFGLNSRLWFLLALWCAFLTMPYLFYALGRGLGILQRRRKTRRIHPL